MFTKDSESWSDPDLFLTSLEDGNNQASLKTPACCYAAALRVDFGKAALRVGCYPDRVILKN